MIPLSYQVLPDALFLLVGVLISFLSLCCLSVFNTTLLRSDLCSGPLILRSLDASSLT